MNLEAMYAIWLNSITEGQIDKERDIIKRSQPLACAFAGYERGWTDALACAEKLKRGPVTHNQDGTPRDPNDIARDPYGVLIHDSNRESYEKLEL